MKHILLVTSEFPPQPGGIGTHALNLAEALRHEGFHVSVVTDQRSESGDQERRFDATLGFSVYRIKKQSVRAIMYFNRVFKVFQLVKAADYVIASGKFSLWNVAICNLFRPKFSLAVVHGTEVNLSSLVSKKMVFQSLNRFDKIVAVSNYTRQMIRGLKVEVTVIPNGINYKKWLNEKRETIRLKGNPKLITVGRISERKGQKHVVNMLPELLKTFPDLHYHCVGIDAEAAAVKALVQELKVSDYVTLHGVVEGQQLKSYLAQSNIFIMLSGLGLKGDVEGFGIAVLEANALGIPAIGAHGSGVEEAIKEGFSGGLIKLGDSEGLKAIISHILSEPDKYRKGAENWVKNHDWNRIVKQYTALLP